MLVSAAGITRTRSSVLTTGFGFFGPTFSTGYQGLSFAIPINVALKVRDQIVATGRAEHARLGVIVQHLNQNLAESFGLPKADGALVVQATRRVRRRARA